MADPANRRFCSWVGVLLACCLAIGGCGGGKKDAAAEGASAVALTAPGDLVLMDKGNGAVTLSWTASNVEPEFAGFNIYGKQKSALGEGYVIAEGVALQVMSSSGQPLEAAWANLAGFGYDPASLVPFNTAGVAGSTAGVLRALPIHSLGSGGAILPTCRHDGAGKCVAPLGDDTTTASGNEALKVTGRISYDVSGLTVGEEYCFFVLSGDSMGGASSLTSSNVACVTPKYRVMASITNPTAGDGSKNQKFAVTQFLTTCSSTVETGETVCGSTAEYVGVDAGEHWGTSGDQLYLENDTNGAAAVAGKYCGVLDLGYYAGGLEDASLTVGEPSAALGPEYNPNSQSTYRGPLYVDGGYAPPGQKLKMLKNHVYVLAVGESDGSTQPAKFFYHRLWLKNDPAVAENAILEFDLMLSKTSR